MATIKIASLPTATEVSDTDYLILDQQDGTKKIPVDNFNRLNGKIRQFSSLSSLRQLTDINLYEEVYLVGRDSSNLSGSGIFYCYSKENTSGLIDDDGFQIITNTGIVLRRKNIGLLSAEIFGAVGGQDITQVIENMRQASITFNIIDAYIPYPSNGLAYIDQGGHLFDLTTDKQFYLHGVSINKGVPINHIGQNICYRFFKNAATQTNFYSTGGIEGFLIRGRDITNTTATNSGIAIEISDMREFEADNLFITGYTNSESGAAISIYNDTSYTEMSKIRATIRSCCNGVWFHRNTATGFTSTNSFFGTELDIKYQAGVGGMPNKGIKLAQDASAPATTNTYDLNLYGSQLNIRYWAEGGSSTRAIFLSGKVIIPESTKLNIMSDGYGFSSSTSDTDTTPQTNFIRVENGAIFRGICKDYSFQTGAGYPLNQAQKLRNTIFSFQDDTYKNPNTDARPYVNPVGLGFICSGTIDVATQQSGASWQISGLPMGMKLKVSIYQYLEGESTCVTEDWVVRVQGDAQSVICEPSNTSDVITTTSGTALVDTTGTTSSFIKTITNTIGRYWRGDSTRTRLTVRNNNDTNTITTGSSDGRKFRIFLPANSSASSILHYSVTVTVLGDL